MDIKNSVAVVTGGASGLGEACVRNLLAKGGKVSILDLARERGEKVASELGDAALFCLTDITKEEDVQTAINKTVEAFGAIDMAVNCAGVGIPAKVVVGVAYVEDFIGYQGFGGHAWTQAYVAGKWVGLDAAFKSAGLGGFDAGHIAMAVGNGEPGDFFNMATALGNFTIEKIVVKGAN